MSDVKCILLHDNFQNFKGYNIPKAQLVIADIPYNIGTDFYASRPDWYVDGETKTVKAAVHIKRRLTLTTALTLQSISHSATDC